MTGNEHSTNVSAVTSFTEATGLSIKLYPWKYRQYPPTIDEVEEVSFPAKLAYKCLCAHGFLQPDEQTGLLRTRVYLSLADIALGVRYMGLPCVPQEASYYLSEWEAIGELRRTASPFAVDPDLAPITWSFPFETLDMENGQEGA